MNAQQRTNADIEETKGMATINMDEAQDILFECGWSMHKHYPTAYRADECRYYWAHSNIPDIKYCYYHDTPFLAQLTIWLLNQKVSAFVYVIMLYLIEKSIAEGMGH